MFEDYNECFSEKELWDMIKKKLKTLNQERNNPPTLKNLKTMQDILLITQRDIHSLMIMRKFKDDDNTLDENDSK